MAKTKFNKRVVGLDSATWANFQGVFGAVIGLGVAVLYSLQNTVEMTEQTNSVLAGMAFGLATGVVAIVVLPLIYYAFGWVIGYLQGFVFNVIADNANGVVLRIEEE